MEIFSIINSTRVCEVKQPDYAINATKLKVQDYDSTFCGLIMNKIALPSFPSFEFGGKSETNNFRALKINHAGLTKVFPLELAFFGAQLEVINLANNQIQFLVFKLFMFNSNLKVANFRNNPLIFIHSTVFSEKIVSALKIVVLSGCMDGDTKKNFDLTVLNQVITEKCTGDVRYVQSELENLSMRVDHIVKNQSQVLKLQLEMKNFLSAHEALEKQVVYLAIAVIILGLIVLFWGRCTRKATNNRGKIIQSNDNVYYSAPGNVINGQKTDRTQDNLYSEEIYSEPSVAPIISHFQKQLEMGQKEQLVLDIESDPASGQMSPMIKNLTKVFEEPEPMYSKLDGSETGNGSKDQYSMTVDQFVGCELYAEPCKV